MSYLMKMCLLGAEFSHEEGQKDWKREMTKLTVDFRNCNESA